jgi:hypothetical protein
MILPGNSDQDIMGSHLREPTMLREVLKPLTRIENFNSVKWRLETLKCQINFFKKWIIC